MHLAPSAPCAGLRVGLPVRPLVRLGEYSPVLPTKPAYAGAARAWGLVRSVVGQPRLRRLYHRFV